MFTFSRRIFTKYTASHTRIKDSICALSTKHLFHLCQVGNETDSQDCKVQTELENRRLHGLMGVYDWCILCEKDEK